MNSNNWLSFPLSPTNSSLPAHLQSSTQPSNQFNLGLVDENLDNPYCQEWNLMNTHGENGDAPKIADFLGVGKSENQSDLVMSFNNNLHDHQANQESEYNNPYGNNNNMVPSIQDTASTNYHDFQENANNLQSLTLSMGSNGNKAGSAAGETSTDTTSANPNVVEATPRRTLDTFGQRTSIYRGVTRHRWTGRYEAHLWDNSCRREGQSRKGRQVYLGGYDKEDKAARAYDLAALKYWGTSTTTNFPINNYEKEVEEMKNMTRQEFVASIRRKSSGFSRGASMYRGVTRHHQHGRWQARIGRVAGNKDLYLGTFSTEEEAAEAYDIAAIKFRGLNAVTNFDMNRYDVKSIMESNTLPIGGGAAKRLKEAQAIEFSRKKEEMLALTAAAFPYGGASSSGAVAGRQLQAYPLMPLQPFEPDVASMSQYSHDATSFHNSYIQTQLQLQQQHHDHTTSFPGSGYLQPGHNGQLYNGYGTIHNNPGLFNGLMGSSVMEAGGYNLGMGLNSRAAAGPPPEEVSMVKIDYDMASSGGSGYGDWSGASDSVPGANGSNFFTMWND